MLHQAFHTAEFGELHEGSENLNKPTKKYLNELIEEMKALQQSPYVRFQHVNNWLNNEIGRVRYELDTNVSNSMPDTVEEPDRQTTVSPSMDISDDNNPGYDFVDPTTDMTAERKKDNDCDVNVQDSKVAQILNSGSSTSGQVTKKRGKNRRCQSTKVLPRSVPRQEISADIPCENAQFDFPVNVTEYPAEQADETSLLKRTRAKKRSLDKQPPRSSERIEAKQIKRSETENVFAEVKKCKAIKKRKVTNRNVPFSAELCDKFKGVHLSLEVAVGKFDQARLTNKVAASSAEAMSEVVSRWEDYEQSFKEFKKGKNSRK